ncbi:MAG: methyltransferase domain-containing protein [Pirellulaceae bacterium]|nr:methyltransferase domain-containing protein [Pirellulaceae bacterium]
MKKRRLTPERMDDPGLPKAEHQLALAGLARLNRWSRGDAGLWQSLQTEARRISPRHLRVLDIATGSGDLPIRLAQRAQSAQLPIQFSACDWSPTALEVAAQAADQAQVSIQFFQLDAVLDAIPSDFDVIMVSLFLHHLLDDQIVQLLAKLGQATRSLVLVNDLVRSWWNFGAVYLASRLLSRSSVVHFDGPVSVQAAFTKAELIDLAVQAGLTNAAVRSQFPARWQLVWRKPQ